MGTSSLSGREKGIRVRREGPSSGPAGAHFLAMAMKLSFEGSSIGLLELL